MKTGLFKKQKVTEVFYYEKDNLAEIFAHDTSVKRRQEKYADKYPELCRQTDDNKQGGLRFEIDKHRVSIRLTAPYSEERRRVAGELAKKENLRRNTK